MAEKKSTSRAQKAVSDVKKKTSGSKTASSSKKKAKVKTEYESLVPSNVMIAFVCLCLFILFVVISINPDGLLLRVVKNILLGLVGNAGFYFAIPALLYLFMLHAFKRMRAVQMRSICTIAFVFLCGMVYHLAVQTGDMASGFAVIKDLYQTGVDGMSGGVLCGGAALLLRLACGTALSFVFTGLGVVITLLGAMQITIPSIIRAIANRPKPEWDEEEEDEIYVEPATMVVNHIANKQIQQKRQRREKAQQAKLAQPVEEAPLPPPKSLPEQTSAPQPEPVVEEKPELPGKGASFMDRVDEDISAPLVGTESYVREEIPQPPVKEPVIPAQMPEFKRSAPVSAPPKIEPKPEPKPEPKKVSAKDTAQSAQVVAAEIAKAQKVQTPEYCFPPIELLKKPGRAGGTARTR